MDRIDFRTGMAWLLGLATAAWLCASPAWAAGTAKPATAGSSEGEMSYTESGPHGATVPMQVLGGVLGHQVIHGVRAELFVLQAEHPELLQPGAPNHLFTVALKDEASGRLVPATQVSLGFGAGSHAAASVPAREFQGMYRAGLRLPAPGEYTIAVAFQSGNQPVSVQFPYRYDAIPAAMGHEHHGRLQSPSPAVAGGGVLPVALETRGARLERSELRASTPAVDLVDSNGQHVALRGLLDQQGPVLVNFIFTSCQAVCPLMSESFARLQRELGADARKVRMVSISIDPEFDRPEVLRTYAQRLHAGPQWHFLTGSAVDISRVQEAFGTLQRNKMDHAAVVLMRGSPQQPWTRLQGLASAADLLHEFQALQP